MRESGRDAPVEALRFDAVLFTHPAAHASLAGLSLLERAAFTMARAGASRLLCVGARPDYPLRLPPLAVSWLAADDADALAAWSQGGAPVVVGADAASVVARETVEALAAAPHGGLLQATGGVFLWRCDPPALAAVVRASAPIVLQRRVSADDEATAGTGALHGEERPRTDVAERRATERGVAPGARTGTRAEHLRLEPAGLGQAAPWTPPPGALLVRADDAAGRAAAERLLYARLGRSGDGWFTRHVDRRISRALTRLLVRTGISPNQITLVSIGVGITAGLLFMTGRPPAAVAGALLFLISTILDGCDGEVARLTFRESRLGARLDIVGDNIVHLVLFGSIATGLYRRAPSPRIAALGALLIAGVLLAMATVYWCLVRRQPTASQARLFEALASREFAYLLVLLTLAGKLEWFLWMAAVGSYAFIAGLLILGRRGTQRSIVDQYT